MKSVGWTPGRDSAADVLLKEILSEKSAMWKIMTRGIVKFGLVGRDINATITSERSGSQKRGLAKRIDFHVLIDQTSIEFEKSFLNEKIITCGKESV